AAPDVSSLGGLSAFTIGDGRITAGGTATACAATFPASSASGKKAIQRIRIVPPRAVARLLHTRPLCPTLTARDLFPRLTPNRRTVATRRRLREPLRIFDTLAQRVAPVRQPDAERRGEFSRRQHAVRGA